MKILLVDDEILLGETLKELLCMMGHEVFYAPDARRAREILARYGPEIGLAIVDIMLPGTSGSELAHWIRRTYPHIKVICITGYTPIPEPEPCGGGVPVIFKPFSVEELRPYLQ
ncbi:MAG TPA: response regulator [Thermosulfurimonas dismutans]|uniref:Response regulator n=1 Tax=Thermosulfurimonas dismutans TaxID=999894 RepID=A0A7C3CG85_9BACT|nr:response regulator [Thermosulfurimonas dismutans]